MMFILILLSFIQVMLFCAYRYQGDFKLYDRGNTTHKFLNTSTYNITAVDNRTRKMLPDSTETLNDNPIYRKFNIPRRSRRDQVNLLIIVSSAPARKQRRDGIRDTWWTKCSSTSKVSFCEKIVPRVCTLVIRGVFTLLNLFSTQNFQCVLCSQRGQGQRISSLYQLAILGIPPWLPCACMYPII